MEELTLAVAALQLLEKLAPVIQQRLAAGQITPEQQSVVRTQYEQFRRNHDAAFTGPEWTVENLANPS